MTFVVSPNNDQFYGADDGFGTAYSRGAPQSYAPSRQTTTTNSSSFEYRYPPQSRTTFQDGEDHGWNNSHMPPSQQRQKEQYHSSPPMVNVSIIDEDNDDDADVEDETTVEGESWRKPGKQFRARLLMRDREGNASNALTINVDCAIERYYQVSEKVFEQFLQHPIDTREDLIEAYLIGSRLSQFWSTVLPTHPDYFHNDNPRLSVLRDESQQHMVELVTYLEQIAKMLDRMEHELYVRKVLSNGTATDKENTQGPSASGRPTQSSHRDSEFPTAAPTKESQIEEDDFGNLRSASNEPWPNSSSQVVTPTKAASAMDILVDNLQTDQGDRMSSSTGNAHGDVRAGSFNPNNISSSSGESYSQKPLLHRPVPKRASNPDLNQTPSDEDDWHAAWVQQSHGGSSSPSKNNNDDDDWDSAWIQSTRLHGSNGRRDSSASQGKASRQNEEDEMLYSPAIDPMQRYRRQEETACSPPPLKPSRQGSGGGAQAQNRTSTIPKLASPRGSGTAREARLSARRLPSQRSTQALNSARSPPPNTSRGGEFSPPARDWDDSYASMSPHQQAMQRSMHRRLARSGGALEDDDLNDSSSQDFDAFGLPSTKPRSGASQRRRKPVPFDPFYGSLEDDEQQRYLDKRESVEAILLDDELPEAAVPKIFPPRPETKNKKSVPPLTTRSRRSSGPVDLDVTLDNETIISDDGLETTAFGMMEDPLSRRLDTIDSTRPSITPKTKIEARLEEAATKAKAPSPATTSATWNSRDDDVEDIEMINAFLVNNQGRRQQLSFHLKSCVKCLLE